MMMRELSILMITEGGFLTIIGSLETGACAMLVSMCVFLLISDKDEVTI